MLTYKLTSSVHAKMPSLFFFEKMSFPFCSLARGIPGKLNTVRVELDSKVLFAEEFKSENYFVMIIKSQTV